MKQVNELIMIIPVILNLKGNLEMNLSARLGTAANVGELDIPDIRRTIIFGNLLLLQVQATVVSFVATCVSFVIGLAVPDPVQMPPSNGTSSLNPTKADLFLRSAIYLRHPRPYIPVKDGAQKSGIRQYVCLGYPLWYSADCFVFSDSSW